MRFQRGFDRVNLQHPTPGDGLFDHPLGTREALQNRDVGTGRYRSPRHRHARFERLFRELNAILSTQFGWGGQMGIRICLS
jgi:hypothetical protein